MTGFVLAHRFTARWEGGLTDHPNDPGGITNYGVSLRWLRSLGHDLGDIDGDGDIDADDVRALTPDQAAALFQARFWDAYDLDALPQLTATAHYDCTVNTGPRQATLITQRACNAIVPDLSVAGAPVEPLRVDGVFGPRTRQFLSAHASQRLAEAMLSQRIAFYCALVSRRPVLAAFERGWLNRCNALRSYVAGW